MTEHVTPIIKAEQMIHTFVGGNYFLEILAWVIPCVVITAILYFLIKRFLNSNSGKPKPKNTQIV